MRKDATKRNKVEFARVKKVNALYLAEDESRQQVTYQRLYEIGTKKLHGRRYGHLTNIYYDDEGMQRTSSKSPDSRFGRESIVDVSRFQNSPMIQ